MNPTTKEIRVCTSALEMCSDLLFLLHKKAINQSIYEDSLLYNKSHFSDLFDKAYTYEELKEKITIKINIVLCEYIMYISDDINSIDSILDKTYKIVLNIIDDYERCKKKNDCLSKDKLVNLLTAIIITRLTSIYAKYIKYIV